MNRPTKTIETPFGKHQVVIKEWITAREREEMQKPMFDALKIKQQGIGEVSFSDFDASLYHKQQHGLISAWVESVDGVNEGILDKCLFI